MERKKSKKRSSTLKHNSDSPVKKQRNIRLGICAMEKKVCSKHMQNILHGLKQFDEFQIITFTEDIIFNKDIEDWPLVEAMIIFFSDGFPYNKALKYINLRKPFLINDFEMQKIFWDRRKVLEILKKENIPTPKNIIIDRGEVVDNDGESVHKLNDSTEIKAMIINYQNEISTEIIENAENEESKKFDAGLKKNQISSPLLNQLGLPGEKDVLGPPRKRSSSNKLNKSSIQEEQPDEIGLIEYDDHIEYKGKKLFKPFVEKPVNGDDHNIYIYYPPSHGGGQKRLFRKTKDLCSLFIPKVNSIRRDKSYIYEEFLQTDGFDIKVYTIGPEYAHAEARKSPSLDGKVQRSSEGKEVRYPVNLTPAEKELARKIVKVFKQNICGFDILRAKGHSYVCDINGWSFVKGNKKYYEDCAILLRRMILLKLDQELYLSKKIFIKKVPIYKSLNLSSTNEKDGKIKPEELRSVVAVFRHADRSPKQKMKLLVEDPEILYLFEKFGKSEEEEELESDKEGEKIPHFKEIKLKKPKELMEVLQIVTNILMKNKIDESALTDISDNFFTKLFQIKMVLEKNLNFEGMTRKIQMKPLKTGFKVDEVTKQKKYFVTEALMIIKWGGNLTHAGIQQAKLLGNTFRVQLYPSTLQDGSGLLRLHSTYRHDLKCYSSDEGRCLKTAAAFLQGLLQLEGPMIPIISSMVRKDDPVCQSLDISCEQIPEIKGKIKQEISECLNNNGLLKDKFNEMFDKKNIYQNYINDEKKNMNFPLYDLINNISNPFERMNEILRLMDNIIEHIKSFLSPEEIELECNSYFIKSVTSIQKRTMLKNYKSLTDEAEKFLFNALEDDNEDYSGIPSPRVSVNTNNGSPNTSGIGETIIKKTGTTGSNFAKKSSTSPLPKNQSSLTPQVSYQEKKEKEKNHSETSSVNQATSSKGTKDCEDEKIILIFKRYTKLKNDFYSKKTNKFDISKVPDIYDNIKYDIIHNSYLLNDDAYELYDNINLLANFVMPLEYGITVKEKMNIGIKVIGPLLNKIQKDLLWWKPETIKPAQEPSELSFSGLDQSRVDSSEIKSSWRQVKTRFYFTCASHMYSLWNLLSFGYDSFLLDLSEANRKGIMELRNVFDLDYCSHIVFRLYENFNVGQSDPKRFRLEIIMSPGSTKNPKEADKNHMINVSPWIVLNNNLTLEQMKEFFAKLIDKDQFKSEKKSI